jgi:hypothetical protein
MFVQLRDVTQANELNEARYDSCTIDDATMLYISIVYPQNTPYLCLIMKEIVGMEASVTILLPN